MFYHAWAQLCFNKFNIEAFTKVFSPFKQVLLWRKKNEMKTKWCETKGPSQVFVLQTEKNKMKKREVTELHNIQVLTNNNKM